jgi:hypothetical protein
MKKGAIMEEEEKKRKKEKKKQRKRNYGYRSKGLESVHRRSKQWSVVWEPACLYLRLRLACLPASAQTANQPLSFKPMQHFESQGLHACLVHCR